MWWGDEWGGGLQPKTYVTSVVGAFVGVLEGLKTEKIMGALVGALMGKISLSPAPCIAHGLWCPKSGISKPVLCFAKPTFYNPVAFTRAQSPKPPFYETALLFPLNPSPIPTKTYKLNIQNVHQAKFRYQRFVPTSSCPASAPVSELKAFSI